MKKNSKTEERKNSKTLIVAIIFTFIVVGLIAFFGSNSSPTGKVILDPLNLSETSEESPVPAQEYESEKIEIPNSNYQIKMINFAYSPSHLEIRAGQTVLWENRDQVAHTVTSKSGDFLNSELMGKGDYYLQTFTNPGTYEYYCKPHPYMQGVIIVK